MGQLSFGQRALVVVFSAVTEELIFRLGIATAVAALTFFLIRKSATQAALVSIGSGILVASVLFGLAHVGNLPDVPHHTSAQSH